MVESIEIGGIVGRFGSDRPNSLAITASEELCGSDFAFTARECKSAWLLFLTKAVSLWLPRKVTIALDLEAFGSLDGVLPQPNC